MLVPGFFVRRAPPLAVTDESLIGFAPPLAAVRTAALTASCMSVVILSVSGTAMLDAFTVHSCRCDSRYLIAFENVPGRRKMTVAPRQNVMCCCSDLAAA